VLAIRRSTDGAAPIGFEMLPLPGTRLSIAFARVRSGFSFRAIIIASLDSRSSKYYPRTERETSATDNFDPDPPRQVSNPKAILSRFRNLFLSPEQWGQMESP
jgi:hypothetical protein